VFVLSRETGHRVNPNPNRGLFSLFTGILHTALGSAVAHAPGRVTLLIGDLAMLHDLSGLALISQQVIYYIYMYIYTYVHIHIYTCIYIYIYRYICICI